MKILAIETSCDETAIAIIDENKNILANIVISQIDIHKEFGGVVPELAARNHLDIIDRLIVKALQQASLSLNEIDFFAATAGPGLIGGLLVGLMSAKTLSLIYNKAFIAVNHLQGHALVARLVEDISFPYLLLLISGGHCQILTVEGYNKYKKLGETIDDSLGETFDKVARMMNLSYPGGPEIERAALNGDMNRFKFPQPLIRNKKHNNNFSFSGLKTAVMQKIAKLKPLSKKDISDVAASFQNTVSEILKNRLNNVFDMIHDDKINKVVISGGVASNKFIRKELSQFSAKKGYQIYFPPVNLCVDNAVMIAWAALERIQTKRKLDQEENYDQLNFPVKARWNLF